ncbi:uncharacterized protein LOC119675122 [Teleopsis dalmanni]|uniref:uncharacterized protein LOC119675122 n=1 Tax=Teleopsis dalmanni TaxID=139649 RepID=UPI0018CE4F49|nr:uncharacterized protein LOC119675122 [Teleopsis dalmanni]
MAHRNCSSKECWIRIKMLGKDCIQTAALLLGSVAESADFMLETQLSGGNNSNNDAITSTEVINQNTNDIECQEQQQQQTQQHQEMRSVVHSMETTTWQEIFSQQYCNNIINNDGNIASNSNSNSSSNFSALKNCSHIVSNGKDDYNLSVISVIYLQQQHRKQQQYQQQNGDAAFAVREGATHAHNLLLNINVRHK